MKKVFAAIICTFIIFQLCVEESFAISAQSAILMDAESGRILYSHNSEEKMGMASTTKIVTAITAIENSKLDSIVTVSPKAYGVEGSSMYLKLGEKLTLEDLLWGLMLVSGNDAATAIAEHVSGSIEAFCTLMNKTATYAEAFDSSFTNPHGLSDKSHYTTAKDLAKITCYALKNPKFREIVSTHSKTISQGTDETPRHLTNHNKFLSMYEGCIGVKTGFTKATGRCLVTAVEKNGMTLVCVTLNAPNDWNDHKEIYDKAFSEYSSFKVSDSGTTLASVIVQNGVPDKITLVSPRNITIPIKQGEERSIKTQASPFEDICAPIKKGDTLGTLSVSIGNSKQINFPLVAAEASDIRKVIFNTEKPSFSTALKKVFSAWLTCFN